jgi:hypothetical protein
VPTERGGGEHGDGEWRVGSGADRWDAAADAEATVECVRWVQQLAVFAPHLAPVAHHVAALRTTIISPQPRVRAAAATALRVLAQRDPAAVRHPASS